MTHPSAEHTYHKSEDPAQKLVAAVGHVPAFAELGLSERVLANVRAAGYETPTPIQVLFMPAALSGRDVMGQAQTGTGKTAAFLLPIFERLQPRGERPQVLILNPTRELALQTAGEVRKLGVNLGFSMATLYGGASYDPQISALAAGADLVVATPGRLMDHLRARRLDLSGIKIAVLDEADRMLDLGFRKDIEYILKHCPHERQTFLLSATIPQDILRLGQKFMRNPAEIWLAPDKPSVEQVEQYYFVTEKEKKLPLLLKLLDEEKPGLAIIFCGTKVAARRLAGKLQGLHLQAREIHGDLVQAKREQIMGSFRRGKVRLLVATDVASRGLDVQDITHIINYDVPYRVEDYIHRIGRTGRMNKAGKAFTFICKDEGGALTDVEQFINRQLHPAEYPTLESRFWPHPPAAPPPEFAGEDLESEVGEADYVEGYDDRHKGHGGDRGRGGRGERGGARGSGGGRRERPAAHAAPSHAAPAHAGHAHPAAPHGQAQVAASTAAHGQAGAEAHAHAHGQTAPAHAGDAGARVSGPATGAAAAGSSADTAAGRGGSRKRRRRARGEAVEIICAACGAKATVHFKPDPGRPVYCDACFAARQADRPRRGGSPHDHVPRPDQPAGREALAEEQEPIE